MVFMARQTFRCNEEAEIAESDTGIVSLYRHKPISEEVEAVLLNVGAGGC